MRCHAHQVKVLSKIYRPGPVPTCRVLDLKGDGSPPHFWRFIGYLEICRLFVISPFLSFPLFGTAFVYCSP